MNDVVFSYYSPFHGNHGNAFLLLSGNSIVPHKDGVTSQALKKDSFGTVNLEKLTDKLGLQKEFNNILQREGNDIILDFYLGDSKGDKEEFVLTEVLHDGVVGAVISLAYPSYVPFIPTNDMLEPSLIEMVYEYSNRSNLNQFLDYHFDCSSVSPEVFIDYLVDFTKRSFTPDVAFNVKPVKSILDWLRAKRVDVTGLDDWFNESSQQPQPTEPGIKLIWNGTNRSLYDLFAQLSLQSTGQHGQLIGNTVTDLAKFLATNVEGLPDATTVERELQKMREPQGIEKAKRGRIDLNITK